MNKEFTPYKEALALKELGLDKGCFSIFNTQTKEVCIIGEIEFEDYLNSEHLYAPTYSQAFRWFREKHKLHSSIDFQKLKESDLDEDIELYEFKINEQWSIGKDWSDYTYGFKHHSVGFNHQSYEEAEIACLRKLIEIAKSYIC